MPLLPPWKLNAPVDSPKVELSLLDALASTEPAINSLSLEKPDRRDDAREGEADDERPVGGARGFVRPDDDVA